MVDISIERQPHSLSRKMPSRKPIDGQNSIRVYNYSPGLIMLQIRTANSYHGITLAPEHAGSLIAALERSLAHMAIPDLEDTQ